MAWLEKQVKMLIDLKLNCKLSLSQSIVSLRPGGPCFFSLDHTTRDWQTVHSGIGHSKLSLLRLIPDAGNPSLSAQSAMRVSPLPVSYKPRKEEGTRGPYRAGWVLLVHPQERYAGTCSYFWQTWGNISSQSSSCKKRGNWEISHSEHGGTCL